MFSHLHRSILPRGRYISVLPLLLHSVGRKVHDSLRRILEISLGLDFGPGVRLRIWDQFNSIYWLQNAVIAEKPFNGH